MSTTNTYRQPGEVRKRASDLLDAISQFRIALDYEPTAAPYLNDSYPASDLARALDSAWVKAARIEEDAASQVKRETGKS